MPFYPTRIGRGLVERDGEAYVLTVPPAEKSTYHDAQLSTYRQRGEFDCSPPLTLHVRARFEGDIRGTAGFGFWNHPYAPNERHFSLPRALWFFYGSPPNNMPLAKGVAGHGWKAGVFDATRPLFFALVPFAPFSFLLMRVPFLYRALWGLGQRAIGVDEYALDESLMAEFHDYTIDWRVDRVIFSVDGAVVLETKRSPKGALGFVAWIDNQYAIVTPQGNFGFGLLETTSPQKLIIDALEIKKGSTPPH